MRISLRAENLHLVSGSAERLRGASLRAEPGRWLALVGPNGGGKSSLLRCLAGLERPTQGEVVVGDRPVHAWPRTLLAQRLAWMPQEVLVPAGLSVMDVAMLGATPRRGPFTLPSREEQGRALALLDELGLAARWAEPAETLSVGLQQRLLLAMRLLQVSAGGVLLLDEVTSAQDFEGLVRIEGLLRGRIAEGATLVSVMHDLNLALRWCDDLAVLAEGRMIAQGPKAEVVGSDALECAWPGCIERDELRDGGWVFRPRTCSSTGDGRLHSSAQ